MLFDAAVCILRLRKVFHLTFFCRWLFFNRHRGCLSFLLRRCSISGGFSSFSFWRCRSCCGARRRWTSPFLLTTHYRRPGLGRSGIGGGWCLIFFLPSASGCSRTTWSSCAASVVLLLSFSDKNRLDVGIRLKEIRPVDRQSLGVDPSIRFCKAEIC